MKHLSRSYLYFLLSVLVMLFASLACGANTPSLSSVDVSVQQTLVALQQTQKALDQPIDVEPTLSIAETAIQVQPTLALPTETPIQPTEAPDVMFEGISFSYAADITNSVNTAIIQGQNLGDDFMPSDTYPTHYEFTFNGYAVGDHFHTPRILVFPVEEYRSISQSGSNQIDSLQAALVNRPGGSSMSNLPFLPMWNAAQIFSAQVSYFDFQNGSGLRYLTMYGQGLGPVDNQNLFYTFQGLTHDGRYYISAVLPVTHTNLPNDGASTISDWMAFEQNWETYLAETLRFLGEQPGDTYTPSLLQLDEMMASFQVSP